MYYTYVIRCIDNSLYTGITNDLERRMNEHFKKTEKCAKYTLKHTPAKLEAVWKSDSRSVASKLEYHFKKLKKEQKELIVKENCEIKNFLDNKIDISRYKRLEIKV